MTQSLPFHEINPVNNTYLKMLFKQKFPSFLFSLEQGNEYFLFYFMKTEPLDELKE